VFVEAALTLLGLPYEVIEQPALTSPMRDQRAAAVNLLRQDPALVLPGGEILTEGAAIRSWRHCARTDFRSRKDGKARRDAQR
jgi:GST-like protein